jgi:hypothetical protein
MRYNALNEELSLKLLQFCGWQRKSLFYETGRFFTSFMKSLPLEEVLKNFNPNNTFKSLLHKIHKGCALRGSISYTSPDKFLNFFLA